MQEQRRTTWIWIAVAGFAAGVAFNEGPRVAHAQEAKREPGVFLVTAPGTKNGENVFFVIDESSQRLLVYEHSYRGKLTLAHARNWEWDAAFQQFPGKNAQKPSVAEVRQAVTGGGGG